MSNLRYATHVEPHNAAISNKLEWAKVSNILPQTTVSNDRCIMYNETFINTTDYEPSIYEFPNVYILSPKYERFLPFPTILYFPVGSATDKHSNSAFQH